MNDFKLMIRLRTYFLGFMGCCLAIACAQQGSIQGGPKDQISPKVLSSTPLNRSAQVHPKEIHILFDEYIQLNDQNKNVVFSPPMKDPAEIKVVRKSLVINIRDTLKEDQTYSILFNKGIGDLNENNLLDGYSYVFSTGTHVDSMRLSGVVVDALTHKPVKECLAMVLESEHDFENPERLPAHVARVNDDGTFRILYMPSGCFKVYALKDNNRDYSFDSLQDELGYTELCVPSYYEEELRDTAGQLIAGSIRDSIRIYLYKPEQPLQVKEADFKNSFLIKIEYNRPPYELSRFEFIGLEMDSTQYRAVWSDDGLSCSLFLRHKVPEQLRLLVYNSQSRDTLKLLNTQQSNLDSMQFKLLTKATAPYFDTLRFQSNIPIDSVLCETFTLIKETDTLEVPFMVKGDGTLFEIQAALSEQSSYVLKVPGAVLVDLYGRRNDSSFQFTFKSDRRSSYATVEFTLKDQPKGPGILEVLDASDKVVYRALVSSHQEKLIIGSRLKAGTYSFRWIEDRNGNGRWDVGRYSTRLAAERVFYFSKTLTLESDWEYEETWSILHSPVRQVAAKP